MLDNGISAGDDVNLERILKEKGLEICGEDDDESETDEEEAPDFAHVSEPEQKTALPEKSPGHVEIKESKKKAPIRKKVKSDQIVS